MERMNTFDLSDIIVACHKNNRKNNKGGKKNSSNKNNAASLRETLIKHNQQKEKPKTVNKSGTITGVGLVNVGNSCYINATLQALFHIVAVIQWLTGEDTSRPKCAGKGHCLSCSMSDTLIRCRTEHSAYRPHLIISKLKMICSHMEIGRQEDAHEFLTYLLGGLQKSHLSSRNECENPISNIFEGCMISTLRCGGCGNISRTKNSFLDICLEIRESESINEAFHNYFSSEKLDDYVCESCSEKCTTKTLALDKVPKSLVIVLNRFSYKGKLDKRITIDPKIDLSPYSLNENETSWSYRLVSMITHLGSSPQSGHYTAIGLSENGTYYTFDDQKVEPISIEATSTTAGYVVFYERE